MLNKLTNSQASQLLIHDTAGKIVTKISIKKLELYEIFLRNIVG
jgi:hypothetical protein